MVDWLLPPAFLWLWLPLIWFVVSSVLAGLFGQPVRFLPRPLAAFSIALALLLVAGAFMGPFVTVLLFIPLWLSFIHVARSRECSVPFRRTFLAVNTLFLCITVAGVVVGIAQRRQRTTAEYICRWSTTAPAHAIFKRLASEDARTALPAYRYILANSHDEYLLANTAEALAPVGTPSDRVLLERALTGFPSDSPWADMMRKAISTLSKRTGGA